MRKFVTLALCTAVSVSLVFAAGCKKGPGGDAAGKVIKDKTTGADISKPLELPKGGGAVPTPDGKAAGVKAPEGK